MKLINLYKKFTETGKMSEDGLCSILLDTKYEDDFNLFRPTYEEANQLSKNGLSDIYWASGLGQYDLDRWYTLTPLREVIILLICAMHNEL